MTHSEGLHVALVGMGFGAEFVPIYRDHPAIGEVTMCDKDADLAATVAERHGISRAPSTFDDVLADPTVDAIHLITGLRDHGDQTVQALDAGKHVACTVPMALSIEDIHRILQAQRRSGKNYMMMETAVYTREFLYAQDLVRRGEFGSISYARGTHFQDMTRWPSYWRGLPPMYYMTHAVAPLLALLATRATSVRALGSGRLPSGIDSDYGNPFPVETAIFELEDSDVVVDITRSLFGTARSYTESFSIYGDRLGFEWPQLEDQERPVLFTMTGAGKGARAREITAARIDVPDRADLLPPEIGKYTQQFVHADGTHLSFVQGGGHGGSHPHLVHEFVGSIQQGRPPVIDQITAANWTAAGIVAHESAQQGGTVITVPKFG